MRGILDSLTTIQNCVGSQIDHVNRGGCGLFTYLVARHLHRLGVGFEILGSRFDFEEDNVEGALHEWRSNNVADCCEWDSITPGSRTHIFLRLHIDDEWWVFDAECLMSEDDPECPQVPGFDDAYRCNTPLPLELLEGWVLNPEPGDWNPFFDWGAKDLMARLIDRELGPPPRVPGSYVCAPSGRGSMDIQYAGHIDKQYGFA